MDGNIFQIISDNFGIIVAIIALIICSILAFKFAITFDVNKFLESRKKRHLGMARNLCLHMEPISTWPRVVHMLVQPERPVPFFYCANYYILPLFHHPYTL